MPAGGSGPHGPFCTSCQGLISDDERKVRIHFNNDPHGHRGLSGLYHDACSKPFASLAHVINMTSFGRF